MIALSKKRAGILAASIIASVAGASIGHADSSSQVASSPAAEGLITSAARADIAQLRRTRSTADAVPAVLNDSPLTVDAVPETSRRIQVSGNRAGWLMAGKEAGQLCYVTLGASTCDDATVLENSGLLWSLNARPGEPTRLEGVAADGISDISAVFSDGSTAAATVSGNGFVLVVPDGKRPDQLAWSGAKGSGTVPLNLPSNPSDLG
jgi:hypothetical protein